MPKQILFSSVASRRSSPTLPSGSSASRPSRWRYSPPRWRHGDLDLVQIPLAVDAAGECAGNLLLLQAGILGYPVIATDFDAHRGLPVTRLPNTPQRWIAVLRERAREIDALRREGVELEAAVSAGFSARAWAPRYGAVSSGVSRRPVSV
jgi:hypothetical protein